MFLNNLFKIPTQKKYPLKIISYLTSRVRRIATKQESKKEEDFSEVTFKFKVFCWVSGIVIFFVGANERGKYLRTIRDGFGKGELVKIQGNKKEKRPYRGRNSITRDRF